jgi:hypothetical protein
LPSNAKIESNWWKENGSKFPYVAVLAKAFLSIPGSQIENKRVFSVAGILTNLRRICLAIDNCSNLIFINKNYPDNANFQFEDEEKTRAYDSEEEVSLLHEYEFMMDGLKEGADLNNSSTAYANTVRADNAF